MQHKWTEQCMKQSFFGCLPYSTDRCPVCQTLEYFRVYTTILEFNGEI